MTAFIYDYLYMLPLALTALYYYSGLFGVERTRVVYLALLLPLTLLALFINLKTRGKLLLFGTVSVASVSFFFIFLRHLKEVPFEETAPFAHLLWISLLSFVLGAMMARMRVLRNILSVILLVSVGLSLEFVKMPENAGNGILAVFFVLILSVANEIHLRWHRQGDTDEKKHMVFTAPFILATIMLAGIFTFPNKPYDWKAFINIWNGITTAFEKVKFNWGQGTDTMIGFSDEGAVKDSAGRSENVVLLEINAPSDVLAPVNLTGTIYDTFDGKQWTASGESLENMRKMDSFESFCAARSGSLDYRDILRSVTVNIKYLNTKSRYVFAPSKAPTITPLTKDTRISENNGVITFKKYNPYHFEVHETFYKLNLDNPVFMDYMAGDVAISEKEWQRAIPFGLSGKSGDFTYEKYLLYKEKIREMYYEEVNVSPELSKKLDLIYEGSTSEYEKLKRLESALLAMHYTRDTKPIPEDVESPGDFLDFFLLDSREGFCTHFATAFVLLARAEGLPARYVQGYRVNVERSGVYTVTSDMAHAWPEVYFEGKGWIPFEPTPGFNRTVSWRTVSDSIIKKDPDQPPPTVFEEPDEPEIEIVTEEPEEEKIRISPLVILVPVPGVLLFLFVFALTARSITKHRFSKLSKENKLRWLLKDILSCLYLMDDRMGENETLREFTERVKDDIGSKSGRFLDISERLLYSDFSIKPSDLKDMFDCHDEVLVSLKKSSRLRYLFKTILSQF